MLLPSKTESITTVGEHVPLDRGSDDDDDGQGSASRIAAVAGYPHLTVPMGFDQGMPVGISFIGGRWEDARILSLGYAFEQKTQARRAPGAGSVNNPEGAGL